MKWLWNWTIVPWHEVKHFDDFFHEKLATLRKQNRPPTPDTLKNIFLLYFRSWIIPTSLRYEPYGMSFGGHEDLSLEQKESKRVEKKSSVVTRIERASTLECTCLQNIQKKILAYFVNSKIMSFNSVTASQFCVITFWQIISYVWKTTFIFIINWALSGAFQS